MLEITVCVGSSCHLKGSHKVIQELQYIIDEKELHDDVVVKAAFCMKHCREGVSLRFEEGLFSMVPGACRGFFEAMVLPRLGGSSSAGPKA